MSLRSPSSTDDSPATQRRPLTVLVVGTHDWAVEQSADALEAAGHTTLRCHEADEPPFPCNALIAGRTCPLEVGFDVVLTVRARPLTTPTAGEAGVICALRAGAPLVVGGLVERHPFGSHTSHVVERRSDLVDALASAMEPQPEPVIDLRGEAPSWQP